MPPTPLEQLSSYGSGTSDVANDRFLSAKQTRERYADASDMWIWRRLHDDSGFPQPVTIAGRRFWRLSDLIAWESSALRRGEAG
jgi:predicted DNA-binding transcriptional regulator AlpA